MKCVLLLLNIRDAFIGLKEEASKKALQKALTYYYSIERTFFSLYICKLSQEIFICSFSLRNSCKNIVLQAKVGREGDKKGMRSLISFWRATQLNRAKVWATLV